MSFLRAAEDLLLAGLNPIPLRENKAPALNAGHSFFKEKCRDLSVFNSCKKIGVCCGNVSENLYCIDFDKHKGEDIENIFRHFISNNSVSILLNRIAVYRTPSGGYHVIFKTEKSKKGTVLARWDDGSTMIETRGEGQYICCSPTFGYIHIAGVVLTDLGVLYDYEENFLIERAKSYNIGFSQERQIGTGIWKGVYSNDTPAGRYNNECENEALQLLIENGWQLVQSPFQKNSNTKYFVRPGKEIADGISASYGKFPKMFYVFSTNAPPFQSNKGYSPFDIFCFLKYNGDKKKALADLSERFNIPIKKSSTEDEYVEKKIIRFPLEVFPEFISEMINDYKAKLNFSEDFTAVAFMYAMAVANGNKYKLEVKKGWQTATIFWFCAVGEPGTMKSHPINKMLEPLKELDRENYINYTRQLDDWNKSEKKDKKPFFSQKIVQDATLEALHKVHTFNPVGIGLHKDELLGFLNDMNKYRSGSDEEFWLESFNNKSYIINRIGKEVQMIDDININIIGTIQPDVLTKITSKGNGLTERFLYTKNETSILPISNSQIDESMQNAYNIIIKNIIKNTFYKSKDDTILLKIDEENFSTICEYDKKLCNIQAQEFVSPNMKKYISKIKTYFPRFILLFALIDLYFESGEIKINESIIKKAEKVCDYFISTAENIFDDSENKKEINEVLYGAKGKTKVEKVLYLYQKGLKKADIARALNTYPSYVSKIISENKY